MEYYVRRQDVLEGEDYTQPYPVQVDDPRAVSVRDFFQAAGAGMCFSLDRYYPRGSFIVFGYDCLPYTVHDGRLAWMVPLDKATLQDLLDAQGLTQQDVLWFETGFPAAGGPELMDALEVWQQLWPILQDLFHAFWDAADFTVTAAGFAALIRGLFLRPDRKEQQPPIPHHLADFLYRRTAWNHFELARLLDRDKEDAQNLLKFFGYRWNPGTQLYEITPEERDKVLAKLEQLPFWE